MGKIIAVISQGRTLLDGAFVSVTSDQVVNHGRSSSGKVTLTAETDSMTTITVHKRGLRPKTKVVRLSSHRRRTRIKLDERSVDDRSKESTPRTTEVESYLNGKQKGIEKAKASLESISEELDDPRSVYRRVLFAHQSLCTVLGSIDRAIAQQSTGEPIATGHVSSLEADIEALEAYADLLASNLEILVEASNSVGADERSIQKDLSASELEQVREFVTDFNDLPTVGKTASLNGEPLSQFGEFVSGWIENGYGGMTVDDRREKMLSVLVDRHDELGRVPKASHLPEDAPFDRQDYLDEFGGWYNAVEATELDYRAELLQDIRDVADTLGHSPNTVEMDEYGHYGHTDVYQFFDTWGDAKEAAIGDAGGDELTEDESTTDETEQATTDDEERERMLSIIVELQDELGRAPKASHLPEDAPFIPQDYVEEFGGWYDALEYAGLDHRGEVLQEIRDVTTKLGRPPTTSELGEYGRYTSGDVYRHFDTWEEAKVAAGVAELDDESTNDDTTSPEQNSQDDVASEVETDAERELLETVRTVARTLGRPPSLTDLNVHSQYDHNDVYAHFDSWRDLKKLAGVSTEASISNLPHEEEPVESTDAPNETELPSSKLAELYEVFLRLSRTVDGIIEATDGSLQENPMAAWRDTLRRFVQDGADDWEDGYGPQQGTESEININRYRYVYGDGNHVTNFQEIETAPLDPVIETVLDRLEIDEDIQSLRLPVAPDSGVNLPIFVESEQEREIAEGLLTEFPERPAIDEWEWVGGREGGTPDDGQGADDSSTDESPTEILKTVSGVEDSEADSLYEAGFESIEDLQEATLDEIAETDGISSQVALRIKADVGGQ